MPRYNYMQLSYRMIVKCFPTQNSHREVDLFKMKRPKLLDELKCLKTLLTMTSGIEMFFTVYLYTKKF